MKKFNLSTFIVRKIYEIKTIRGKNTIPFVTYAAPKFNTDSKLEKEYTQRAKQHLGIKTNIKMMPYYFDDIIRNPDNHKIGLW